MKQYSKFKLTRYHKTNKTFDNNKITRSVTTVIFTPSRNVCRVEIHNTIFNFNLRCIFPSQTKILTTNRV